MGIRERLIAFGQAALRAVGQRWRRRSSAAVFIALGMLGIGARVVLALCSLGSNDILTWKIFGEEIWRLGVAEEYRTNYMFNHPPLMGLLAGLVHALAERLGWRFEVLFKLPPILADAFSAWLIHRAWQKRGHRYAALAFAAFCWNPVSILVSSYHGNTDAMCASLALLAAVLVEGRSPLLGGLALAASINVKLIPVLLIPVLLSCIRTRKDALRFGLGLSAGVIPFVPIAWARWGSFYDNVLCYRSYPGEWGITEIGRQLGLHARFKSAADTFNIFWIERGKIFVFAFAVVLATINRWKRRHNAPAIAATLFAGFLVLAPGWGVQYAVYIVPVLFVTHLGYAVAYSTVTGLYLLYVYAGLWTGTYPFFSEFSQFYSGSPVGARHLAGVAWTLSIVIFVRLLRMRTGNDDAYVPRSTERRNPIVAAPLPSPTTAVEPIHAPETPAMS